MSAEPIMRCPNVSNCELGNSVNSLTLEHIECSGSELWSFICALRTHMHSRLETSFILDGSRAGWETRSSRSPREIPLARGAGRGSNDVE